MRLFRLLVFPVFLVTNTYIVVGVEDHGEIQYSKYIMLIRHMLLKRTLKDRLVFQLSYFQQIHPKYVELRSSIEIDLHVHSSISVPYLVNPARYQC